MPDTPPRSEQTQLQNFASGIERLRVGKKDSTCRLADSLLVGLKMDHVCDLGIIFGE